MNIKIFYVFVNIIINDPGFKSKARVVNLLINSSLKQVALINTTSPI